MTSISEDAPYLTAYKEKNTISTAKQKNRSTQIILMLADTIANVYIVYGR